MSTNILIYMTNRHNNYDSGSQNNQFRGSFVGQLIKGGSVRPRYVVCASQVGEGFERTLILRTEGGIFTLPVELRLSYVWFIAGGTRAVFLMNGNVNTAASAPLRS